MFANNRIDKLKTRDVYDINSIRANRGAINKGVPVGKNILKNNS